MFLTRFLLVALGLVLPTALEAQMAVDPASSDISAPGSSSGTTTFTLRTEDPNSTQNQLQVTCDGAVVSCSTDPWVRIDARSPATITVSYTTGGTAGATGTITLSMTDELTGEMAEGSVTLTIQIATPRLTADQTTQYTAENFQTNYPGFHLTNGGDIPGTYTATVITCSGSISNCAVRVQPPTDLAPGTTTDLIVDYRSGNAVTGNATITLQATSQLGEVATRTVTIVPLSEAVSVTPDGSGTTLAVNGTTTLPFTVHETGNAGSGFNYTVTASCSGSIASCTFSATGTPTMTLPPGPGVDQSAPVVVRASSSLAGGSGTVTVIASTTNSINQTYQDQGSYAVTVPDARTYTVGVSPSSTTTSNEANVSTNYSFTVTNSGNTQASYTLTLPTCTGTVSGCSFSPSSAVTSTTITVSGNNGTKSVPVYFTTGAAGQNVNIALQAAGPSNTVTGSVTLIPQAPTVQVSAGAAINVLTHGSGTLQFSVQNVGTSGQVTYNLSVTGCTAPLTSCSAPTSVTVPQGSAVPVSVTFQTQNTTGTGQITLQATAPRPPFVNLYQSAATGTGNVSSPLTVSTAFMNNDNQDMGLCAASCFAMAAARSTVPYFTLDAARGITLVYHGDRAFPRPFVYADVTVTSPPATVQNYLLEVKRNGLRLPFTNGDSVLVFQGTTGATMRLAGQLQLDPETDTTGAYPVTVVVTALYSNQTSDVTSIDTKLLIVNTRRSPIAKGWTVAGVPRLYAQGDGSALIVDGTGSAVLFQSSGGAYAAPQGDYTTLVSSGSGWKRTSLDNSTAWFNAAGRADSVTDRLGFSTRFEYDAVTGNLVHVYDPMLVKTVTPVSKAATTLVYGSSGLSSIQEPNPVASFGRVTLIHVSSDSLLKAVVDPDNDSTAYGYDAQQRLSTIRDRNGNTTTYSYGATWKLAQVTSPAVPIDDRNGGTTVQQPVVTMTPWQAVGVPTARTDAASPATPIRADTIAATVTDPEGHTAKFTVNRWGQPMRTTDALGNVVAHTRTGTLVTSDTIPDGRPGHIAGVNHYEYQGAYLTMAQAAGSDTVFYGYGPAAQIVDVSGPGVAAEHHYLRADGRSDSVQYAGSAIRVTRYDYDPLTKRVATVVNAAEDTARFSYDPVFGNLIQAIAPGGRTTTHHFDAYGRDTSVTTPATTQFTRYDIVNRAVYDSVAGSPGATRLEYYPDHQLVTDAVAQVYRTDFDALGQVTAEHSPDPNLAPITHRYDSAGHATSMTNRRGQTVSATYDALGRVLTRSDPVSGLTTFRYPWLLSTVAVGPKFVDSTTVTLTCAGDPTCSSDSTTVTYGGVAYTLGHTTPGSFDSTATATNTEYDPNAENQSFVTRQYTTNPALGLPSAVTLGPLALSYTYDDSLGLRTGTTLPGSLGSRTEGFTANGERYGTRYSLRVIDSLYARAYHYDLAGRLDVMQRSHNGSTSSSILRSFAYDTVGRLRGITQWTAPCGAWPAVGADSLSHAQGWRYNCGGTVTTSESYVYDAVGNRKSVTSNGVATQAVYATGNRLMTMGVFSFEYDADGNLTRKLDTSTGEDRHFYYDAGGQLDSVSVEGGPNPTGGVFLEYDPYGRLSHRMWYSPTGTGAWTSTVRLYLWRGADLMKEVSFSEGLTREYEYDGTDRPILRLVRDGDGVVVGKTTYLYDATGSVIGGVTGGATGDGAPVPSINYGAWGEWTSVANNPSTTRFGFKGMLYDETLGIYYARARWYDPSIGRFTQEDRIGLSGGLNAYVYTGDDPVNGSDPSGMYAVDKYGIVCSITLTTCGDDPLAGLPGHLGGGGGFSGGGGGSAWGGNVQGAIRSAGGLTQFLAMLELELKGQRTVDRVYDLKFPGPALSGYDKIDYVLGNVPSNKDSQSKGGYFVGYLGFTRATLPNALREHFLTYHESGVIVEGELYAPKIEIPGMMTGPNGRQGMVVTVWQYQGGDTWQFVTAVPGRKP